MDDVQIRFQHYRPALSAAPEAILRHYRATCSLDGCFVAFVIIAMQARYTDPETKLRYHSAAEYAIIKTLTPNVVSHYLALRGAASNPID